MFAPIGADPPADRTWLTAAEILLEAAHGDQAAVDIVAAHSAAATSVGALATALRGWAVLDGADAAQAPDTTALATAAAEPRLLSRLLDRGRAPAIARAIVAGQPADGIVEAARRLGRANVLTAAFARRARAAPARRGAGHAGGRAERARPAHRGHRGRARPHLAARRPPRRTAPREAVSLLTFTGGAADPELVAALLSSSANAQAVVDDRRLPAAWHGYAAAVHPGVIGPRELADRLAREWDFADGYLHAADVARLADLLAAVPTAQAHAVLKAVDRRLREGERAQLALPVVLRLEPHSRLSALLQYAPAAAQRPPEWNEALLDAFVHVTLATRARTTALTSPSVLDLGAGHAPRVRAWQELSTALKVPYGGSLSATRVDEAARAAASLPSADDVDAALEVIVDGAAERLRGTATAWESAMSTVRAHTTESTLAFAARPARAAVRAAEGDRRAVAMWTILWLADLLDACARSRPPSWRGRRSTASTAACGRSTSRRSTTARRPRPAARCGRGSRTTGARSRGSTHELTTTGRRPLRPARGP